MESDDDNFAKQGGEGLEIGDDFDSEEETDALPAATNDAMRQPMKAAQASGSKPVAKAADVKGAKVED